MGDRIKQLRETAGISKSELATMIGVSRSLVSQWENGTIKSARPKNLFKPQRALHCSPEWISEEEGLMDETGVVADVIAEMGVSGQLAVFDHIAYQIERSPTPIAKDKVARYIAMVERIKSDAKKRGSI
jgi:transcriptional regulator with XRE-family HTH domain